MKFLVPVLFVAVVAGNIFHQPFSPLTQHPWKIMSPIYQPFLTNKGHNYYPTQPNDCGEHQDYLPYYDYFPYYLYDNNILPGIFSVGQQRSPIRKNDRDQSVQNWQRNPVESKGLGQRSRWNQKFFLLDNDAETVHALRPFNPLEMLNYQFSQMKPSSPLTRPMFARRTVVMTITATTSTTSTKICILSNLFSSTYKPTLCPMLNPLNRLFKSNDILEDENILPSPPASVVVPVAPTVLTTLSQQSPVHAIESSKDEDVNEESDFGYYDLEELTRKDRAMFGSPFTATVTVFSTHTYFVTRAVSPIITLSGSPVGLFLCVPPGLVVCA